MDSYNWTTSQIPPHEGNAPKVYTVFSGIGGSSFGYRLAGMSCLGACDIDNKAIEYYKKFHHTDTHDQYFHTKPLKRVLKSPDFIEEIKQADIIHASPPMPSLASITAHDPNLIDDTLQLVRLATPKVFIMVTDNNLSLPKFSGYLREILLTLNSLGYETQSFNLDCVDFGVAQKQEFSVLISHRLVDTSPIVISPTTTNRDEKIPCGQAFKHLTQAKPLPKSDPAYSSHEVLIKYHHFVAKGSNYGTAFQQFRKTRAYTNWTKIDDLSPSFTLTSLPLLSHYQEPRFLTLQEYICLSSFPQDTPFGGSEEVSNDEYQQTGKYLIGSSIPPFLMKAVGESVMCAFFK